ncbi:hypothetical protein OAD26_00645 [bacterium]|nr:hypothetical protein [bacterium]
MIRYRLARAKDSLFKALDIARPMVLFSVVTILFSALFFGAFYIFGTESFLNVLLIVLLGIVFYIRGYYILIKRLPLYGDGLTTLYVGWYLLAVAVLYMYIPYLVLASTIIAQGTIMTIREHKKIEAETSNND